MQFRVALSEQLTLSGRVYSHPAPVTSSHLVNCLVATPDFRVLIQFGIGQDLIRSQA